MGWLKVKTPRDTLTGALFEGIHEAQQERRAQELANFETDRIIAAIKGEPDPLVVQEQQAATVRAHDEAMKAGMMENLPGAECPHCHVKGYVYQRPIEYKAGVSGAKVAAGVLTAGISLIGTGVAKKTHATQLQCNKCQKVWEVANNE